MKFFQLVPSDTNFDFIGKLKYFLAFSIITFIVIVYGIATKGLNYGIDFTGGTVVHAQFATPKTSEEIRKLVADLGEPDASVVSAAADNKDYLITSRTHTAKDSAPFSTLLSQKMGSDVKILSAETVGPKVGSELKKAAMLSLFYAVILITVYIWLRFDIRFAPGATIAMIHDLVMATGFYLFTGAEFNITAIAALLTIAGYSVNDTIVIYDRVREMYKIGGDALPLATTINKAINITLSRTLLTAAVTFISIIPIIIFCSGEIRDFAITMCFGIFVGVYSTIYIASPLTIYVAKFLDKKQANRTSGKVARA